MKKFLCFFVQIVNNLVDNEYQIAGKHYVKFRTETAGVYFYRLTTTGSKTVTGKITNLR